MLLFHNSHINNRASFDRVREVDTREYSQSSTSTNTPSCANTRALTCSITSRHSNTRTCMNAHQPHAHTKRTFSRRHTRTMSTQVKAGTDAHARTCTKHAHTHKQTHALSLHHTHAHIPHTHTNAYTRAPIYTHKHACTHTK